MTLSQETQQFERLIQKLAPQGKLLRVWPLKGGISAEMTAFEVALPGGQTRKMIVRQPGEGTLRRNPQAAEEEFRLLEITQALGLATQKPYYLDQAGEIFATPAFVIEYIEGKPEFAPSNLADFSRQLATHLAQIHSIAGSNPDLAFLPQGVKSFEATFKRPTSLNESMEEGRIREILEAVWPLPQRNAPVLLHGDYWPGNILWREEKLVAVIDWEDARIGDPLSDLAISRLDLLWIYSVEAMESFTHHYQALMPLDYTDLPYWDLAAALRLVRLAGADLAEWAAFYPPFGRHDITEQTIREHYRFFISQAFEKLG